MALPAGARARTKLSLKGRALALLAQRDHSAAELRRKLLRHVRAKAAAARGEPGAAESAQLDAADAVDVTDADDGVARVDAVIDWLRSQRYLSEERFVESRIHARAGRYGNLRIRQELAQHGVAMPREAAQQLADSELQRATSVWQRKFGVAPADAAQRVRQARFLAQRGFSADVVARVMRSAGAPRGTDDD